MEDNIKCKQCCLCWKCCWCNNTREYTYDYDDDDSDDEIERESCCEIDDNIIINDEDIENYNTD